MIERKITRKSLRFKKKNHTTRKLCLNYPWQKANIFNKLQSMMTFNISINFPCFSGFPCIINKREILLPTLETKLKFPFNKHNSIFSNVRINRLISSFYIPLGIHFNKYCTLRWMLVP